MCSVHIWSEQLHEFQLFALPDTCQYREDRHARRLPPEPTLIQS